MNSNQDTKCVINHCHATEGFLRPSIVTAFMSSFSSMLHAFPVWLRDRVLHTINDGYPCMKHLRSFSNSWTMTLQVVKRHKLPFPAHTAQVRKSHILVMISKLTVVWLESVLDLPSKHRSLPSRKSRNPEGRIYPACHIMQTAHGVAYDMKRQPLPDQCWVFAKISKLSLEG